MSDIKNPIDMLFDENCDDNIVLFDENGEPTEFEQIAIIPMEGTVYCILRPLDIPELADDEAFVFAVCEGEGEEEDSLDLVDDDETIDKVFELYYSLLDEDE